MIENKQMEFGKENSTYKKDFRDPKVFLNTIRGGFSLVVAAGHYVEFYHSNNLISWEKTGEFAPKPGGFEEICECPDCFPVETEEGTKWILTLSLTSHVMPYYVGLPDEIESLYKAEAWKQTIWHGNIKQGEMVTFSLGERKTLSISVTEDEIRIDRSNAGDCSFSDYLQEKGTVLTAKRVLQGVCETTVIQDNGYFEIFAEGGFTVFSVMIY